MNKKRILLILGLCLCGLLLGLFWAWHWKQAPDHPLRFWTASFSPDGKMLATAGGQSDPNEEPRMGEVVFWEVATGKKKRVVRQEASLRTVAWAPNGKFVAIGDFNGSTKLVAPSTGKPLAFLPPHSHGINALAISADSALVASGSLDGTITLWEVAGKELDPLVLPDEKVLSLAIAPDRHALVAGTQTGKAYLFDLVQRGEPQILAAYQGPPKQKPGVEAVAFAPNGGSFVTACQKTLRLWETATGRQLRDLGECTAEVNGAAFSPTGETLATIDSRGTLTLWNPSQGNRLESTSAHSDTSFCVLFSPNGQRLATIGRTDFTVRLWDAKTLGLITTFRRVPPPRAQRP